MYLFETLSCLRGSSCARSTCALFKVVTSGVCLHVGCVTAYQGRIQRYPFE